MNQIATVDSSTELAVTTNSIIANAAVMDAIDRFADMMATGKTTVPAHIAGSKGDCMAIIMQAAQWGMNPYSVAQKTHLINGALGYEAQLVNSVITARAPIIGRLKYDWFGNWDQVLGKFRSARNEKGKIYHKPDWQPNDEQGLGVRVWATFIGDDEPTELSLLLVQAQVRNSTLWASDPKQQLAYLAVKRWARLHCPEVILGVYTPDELEEREPEREINPVATRAPASSLKAQIVQPVEAEVIPEPVAPIDYAATINALSQACNNCQTVEDLEQCGNDIAEFAQENPGADLTPVRATYRQAMAALSPSQQPTQAPVNSQQLPEFPNE